MRKGLAVLYLLLIIYSLFHLITNFSDGGMLQGLIQNEGDPYLIMVFNLLGLFPLAFILYGLKYLKMSKFDWTFLGLGFMLGGFMLTVPFLKSELKPKPVSKKTHVVALVGMILSILIIGYGVILGDFNAYLDAFNSDSFVHIMTIDFFFLYGLSVYLASKSLKPWGIAFIPVIGFYYLLFQDVH